jgi:hypothetical protein
MATLLAFCARDWKVSHGNSALREMLARMTDAELIEAYLRNEEQRRNDVARRGAEKAASE